MKICKCEKNTRTTLCQYGITNRIEAYQHTPSWAVTNLWPHLQLTKHNCWFLPQQTAPTGKRESVTICPKNSSLSKNTKTPTQKPQLIIQIIWDELSQTLLYGVMSAPTFSRFVFLCLCLPKSSALLSNIDILFLCWSSDSSLNTFLWYSVNSTMIRGCHFMFLQERHKKTQHTLKI